MMGLEVVKFDPLRRRSCAEHYREFTLMALVQKMVRLGDSLSGLLPLTLARVLQEARGQICLFCAHAQYWADLPPLERLLRLNQEFTVQNHLIWVRSQWRF